jgi:hypothetical protein
MNCDEMVAVSVSLLVALSKLEEGRLRVVIWAIRLCFLRKLNKYFYDFYDSLLKS